MFKTVSFNFKSPERQGFCIRFLEDVEIHPGANIAVVLVPPLELLDVSGEVAVDEADVRSMEPQAGTHPALVSHLTHDASANGVH